VVVNYGVDPSYSGSLMVIYRTFKRRNTYSSQISKYQNIIFKDEVKDEAKDEKPEMSFFLCVRITRNY